ncbi:endoglucanase EG-1 precursor [Trichodelitschia bisporula]|uniref:Glucanase n=1 Tax=Trichodelitschia bisporula TaxID=703511 RepID=A0A6G1HMP3_9PEZI|nr:endoglucanase EG-1 precursor [Trichodelitschia bisporula]
MLPIILLLSLVAAQQPGTNTPERHPSLPSSRCTVQGGCVPANTSIVLDSNFRWLHNVGGYTNCMADGKFNTSICSSPEGCVTSCAVEGVDYAGYGIKTQADSVTMNLFTVKEGKTQLASPRIYLFDEAEGKYANFQLLDREFSFDVDMSKAGCGVNGALYFSEMDMAGDAGKGNTAGAKYGTGYCDAQCPKQNFIHGKANLDQSLGACCSEMDIWEANSAATAFTPHPCNETGVYACKGELCGDKNRLDSVCDRDGCDFNGYRNGAKSFYGKGADHTVDTTKPFTVVTQFYTKSGALTEIKRLYVQGGKVIPEATSTVKGIEGANSMTDGYCSTQKQLFGGGAKAPNAFATQGGMKVMGEALGRGMVLAMAIWHDAGGYMHWLDSTVPNDSPPNALGAARGPCPTTGGRPAQIQTEQPDAAVTFSKIRWGEIGSTYK